MISHEKKNRKMKRREEKKIELISLEQML